MERHGGDKPKRMAVPQFGAWDQKGGASPNYSVVFGQARAKRKQAKKQIKLGNEANLVAKPEQNEYKLHNEVDFQAKIRISTDHETLRPKYELKFDNEQVDFKTNKNHEFKLHNEANHTRHQARHAPNLGHQQANFQPKIRLSTDHETLQPKYELKFDNEQVDFKTNKNHEFKLHNEANHTMHQARHTPNHGHQQANYQQHHHGHYRHYHQNVGVVPGWKSIPQFGSWDQKGDTSPNYSAVFSQARKIRRLAKQDAHYVKLNLAQDQTNLAHQTHHVRGYHYNHQRHRYQHHQDNVSKRRFMNYIRCCMRPQH